MAQKNEFKHEYIIGNIYGVKKLLKLYRNNKNRLRAEVECIHCYKISQMNASDLYRDSYISCTCLRHNKDYPKERLYGTYHNMKYRCYNPNAQEYYNYGGKGVRVCNEWLGEDGYKHFREWALSHGYQEGLSIDRIDSDGNYEPGNCQWLTIGENTAKSNRIIQHRFANKGEYYGIDPDGNEYTFNNASEFARNNGLHAGCVRQVANGEKKQHKGWKFGFVSERDKLNEAI